MANSQNTRFTLMAFPQQVDANGILSLHILFIPRNFSPLEPLDTLFSTTGTSPAFADTKPNFSVIIANNPDEFPGKANQDRAEKPPPLPYSALSRPIYEKLKNTKDQFGKPVYFDIDENYSAGAGQSDKHRAPIAEEPGRSIKKYLPQTYQKAFNFTSPRSKNAVTDDSYQCAMRDNQPPIPVPKSNKVSWGKVYAYLLRQPLLAEKAGLLYKTSVQLKPEDYQKGGWLYVDIIEGSYGEEQKKSLSLADDVFIKRYAARIPPLKRKDNAFVDSPLFAAVLFPVVKLNESPKGIYDELYIESAEYNDGFAKIVHANQPVSGNLLSEKQDGLHPQKEMGIRLGWDDEQILIWYLRQLAKDPSVENGTDRLDAPLGVMGYHIDVRDADVEQAQWESLTAVESKEPLDLEGIPLGSYQGELPFQVYPVKLYGVNTSNYWLPMYFSNWNDHSLVLPDETAADIYRNSEALEESNKVSLSNNYRPKSEHNKLRYSKSYEFRVRLSDITGGGPTENQEPSHQYLSDRTKIRFKRYVAPYALRIINQEDIQHSTDDLNFNGDTLRIKRPLIGYPSVVYTGKYSDPVSLLKANIQQQIDKNPNVGKANLNIGIADPDVVRVSIKVEIETLQMDNLRSDSGKENYITLYTTSRSFDTDVNTDDFEQELALNFQYKDYSVLNFEDLALHPFGNDEDDDHVRGKEGSILLPTSRNIRITLRAECNQEADYWGNVSHDPSENSCFGKTTVLKMRRDAKHETNLLAGIHAPRILQGIFLQPDPIIHPKGRTRIHTLHPSGDGMPKILQRLAQQLGVNCNNDSNNMTLTAERGERIQFWCSNLIRHTLSPDNSSLTFAGKNELIQQWFVATTFYIDRDWTWSGLETLSFTLERKKSTSNNASDPQKRKERMETLTYQPIGEVETRRIASFQSIQEGLDGLVHREYTKIIFIDVIDPLPAEGQLPDTTLVKYRITPHLKAGITLDEPSFETPNLLLPTTINPSQIPKVIGSGIALSPYIRNDKYTSTEARKRYLWLEFDSLPSDSRDALFARQVAYAPDQLISNNHPSLFKIEEESPLNLDPEYTRVIIPESAHDHAGLKAMIRMQKSTDTSRHFYLLPLPDGLHPESPELFGFHTYEFRFGHTDQLWSTAHGRYGRPFRLTGLQHPAPTLLCRFLGIAKKFKLAPPLLWR